MENTGDVCAADDPFYLGGAKCRINGNGNAESADRAHIRERPRIAVFSDYHNVCIAKSSFGKLCSERENVAHEIAVCYRYIFFFCFLKKRNPVSVFGYDRAEHILEVGKFIY